MRARSFLDLCREKTIHLGDGELIVGERGPAPKAVPTFPELTCHSIEDLGSSTRARRRSYAVTPDVIESTSDEVIPYWRGRSLRDRLFATLPPEWHAPTRRASSPSSWSSGPRAHRPRRQDLPARPPDFKADIAAVLAALDYRQRPRGLG